MCKWFFKLTWCLQRGFCWAHSMRNIWENYIWQSKIRPPVLGIWNPFMSHLCIVFFGMGDKTRSFEIFEYPYEFRKNCRKKLWQKQKTLFKKDSYRCHGPQKKSWLRCLFSGWDFWRLDGLEELWIFRTPKLTSSWPGFFFIGTKSSQNVGPYLRSRFVHIFGTCINTNLNFNGIMIYSNIYAAFSRGITLISLCAIMLIF